MRNKKSIDKIIQDTSSEYGKKLLIEMALSDDVEDIEDMFTVIVSSTVSCLSSMLLFITQDKEKSRKLALNIISDVSKVISKYAGTVEFINGKEKV